MAKYCARFDARICFHFTKTAVLKTIDDTQGPIYINMAEMTPKLTSVWAQKNAEANLQTKLEEQLVRIMLRQNVSTCFFDGKDLQELVKITFPGQKIYTRWHFTQSVIPRMAGEI
uniref:MULE transposase domain-containing protein n=1 Tax=Globodera rostochiensis TaxID=31243 RepID=A0A914I6Q6_GLORO